MKKQYETPLSIVVELKQQGHLLTSPSHIETVKTNFTNPADVIEYEGDDAAYHEEDDWEIR